MRIPRKIKKALKHVTDAKYPQTKWIRKAKQKQKKLIISLGLMAGAFARLACAMHEARYGWITKKYPKGGI